MDPALKVLRCECDDPHNLFLHPIQVFDVRFAIRPLLSLPLGAAAASGGATSLTFHPTFSNTLLISSASGLVSFADIGVGAIVQTYQV